MISINKIFESLVMPDVRQSTNYTCGPTVMLSILTSYNIESREDTLSKLMNTTENGTEFSGFIKIAEKYNVKYEHKTFTISDIKSFIDNNYPSIILIQAYANNKKINYITSFENGHYVIPIDYDKDKIYFEDPSVINRISYLTYKEFEDRWHGLDENNEKIYNEGIVFLKQPEKTIKKFVHMESFFNI